MEGELTCGHYIYIYIYVYTHTLMDSVKLLGQLVKDLGGKGFEDWPQGF